MNQPPLISHLGQLKNDQEIPEWFVSKEIPIDFFDGKSLVFRITIEKEFDPRLVKKIELAVQEFLKLGPEDRQKISQRVYENYQSFLEEVDIDPLDIQNQKDVWKFVSPTMIDISQRKQDENIYIQVLCECEWDEENGLKLVFKNGQELIRVSEQDEFLIDEDVPLT